jgi:hypothetical protein
MVVRKGAKGVWPAGFTTKHTELTKVFKECFGSRGWPRKDTDDQGRKLDRVVLVLSVAVLVIVIGARDVGWTGLARGGLTRRLEGHEGLKDTKA